MTVNEQLEKLANDEGEITIGPDKGQDLKSFQADVRRLGDLANRGIIDIVREHQESSTGKSYVDRVRIRLASSGDELRQALES
jgi:hypothetical protein